MVGGVVKHSKDSRCEIKMKSEGSKRKGQGRRRGERES